ncbi:MAG: cupin domain-containing protein [Gemmatimonas sp.]
MANDTATKNVKTIEEFDADLAKLHIRGQWQYDALLEKLLNGPPPAGVAHIWKWAEIHEKLLEACEVMPESLTARRNFSFLNPKIERGGTTHTLLMGMQMVMPGEVAWAHRHTIGALRFVVEGGEGLYTAVDGEPLPMEPNDLILTPSWTWHDHHNETTRNAVWLDVLDVPIVLGLNQAFYQPYGTSTQPLRDRAADCLSERGALVRPAWEQRRTQNFPFRYRWTDILPQLERMSALDGTPYDGVALEYVNPITGASILPTMGAWLQLLKPGFEGKAHRRTSSAVFYVVEGEGTLVAGDREIQWGPRDSFVVPNWMQHRLINRSPSDRAILFSVNDIPLLEPLGLYREEPEHTLRSMPPPVVPAEAARTKR